MGTFRFTYDDDNLKEIKVVCKYEGEKDREDLLDTIKTFCIENYFIFMIKMNIKAPPVLVNPYKRTTTLKEVLNKTDSIAAIEVLVSSRKPISISHI